MDIGSAFILILICFTIYRMYEVHDNQNIYKSIRRVRNTYFEFLRGGKHERFLVVTSMILFLSFIFGIFFHFLLEEKMIESMYKGESLNFLNNLLHRRPNKTLEEYLFFGRIIFSRLMLVGMVLQLIILVSLFKRQVFRYMELFFTTATHPINLAIFRIVFFSSIFFPHIATTAVFYSELPVELRFLPSGLGWLFNYFPANEMWGKVFSNLYLIFCFTAIIGFWSRTSALLTAICGFYILGIPQLYGKVNHYHHII